MMRESGQLLAALEVALGERDARLGRRDLRLGALDLGRVGRGIDGDEQIALLDQRAFAEMHGLHRAGDARADLDALDRLEAAGELVPDRDVALLDHRDRNRRRLRRRCGRRVRLRAAAGAA